MDPFYPQGNVEHDSADFGKPIKIGGVATAAVPAPVDELDRVQASFTRSGQLRVDGTLTELLLDLTYVNSGALEETRVVVAAPARMFQAHVTSDGLTNEFFQLHDLAAVPAPGAVPVLVLPFPAGGSIGIDFGENGRLFTTGIVWVISDTAATYTVLGVSTAFGSVGFLP